MIFNYIPPTLFSNFCEPKTLLDFTATCKTLRERYKEEIHKILIPIFQEKFFGRKYLQTWGDVRKIEKLNFYSDELFELFGGLDNFYNLPRFRSKPSDNNSIQDFEIVQSGDIKIEHIEHPISLAKDPYDNNTLLIIKYIVKNEESEKIEFEAIACRNRLLRVFRSEYGKQFLGDLINDAIFIHRLKKLINYKLLYSADVTKSRILVYLKTIFNAENIVNKSTIQLLGFFRRVSKKNPIQFNSDEEQQKILEIQQRCLSRKLVQNIEDARKIEELGFYSKRLFKIFGGIDQFYNLPRFNFSSEWIDEIDINKIKYPISIVKATYLNLGGHIGYFLVFKYIVTTVEGEREEYEALRYPAANLKPIDEDDLLGFKSHTPHQEISAYAIQENYLLNNSLIFERMKSVIEDKPICAIRGSKDPRAYGDSWTSKIEFFKDMFKTSRVINGKSAVRLIPKPT